MGEFVVVSKALHEKKFWKRPSNFSFIEKTTVIPLSVEELPFALKAFPLAFIKVEDSFNLVAVMGLRPEENLFVDKNGIFLGLYMPAFVLSYPFRLGKIEDGKLVLMIDNDFVSEDSKDNPFFKDGEFSNELKNIMNMIGNIEKSRSIFANVGKILSDNELIEPFQLKLKLGGRELNIEGLYKVNELKLDELPDEKFLELRKSGALHIIYAHLYSLSNVNVLSRLLAMKLSHVNQPEQKTQTKQTKSLLDVDIEEMFKNLKFPE